MVARFSYLKTLGQVTLILSWRSRLRDETTSLSPLCSTLSIPSSNVLLEDCRESMALLTTYKPKSLRKMIYRIKTCLLPQKVSRSESRDPNSWSSRTWIESIPPMKRKLKKVPRVTPIMIYQKSTFSICASLREFALVCGNLRPKLRVVFCPKFC